MLGVHLCDFYEDGLGIKAAYFLERPHGNYLFFSSHMKKIDKSFFTSKGGIFKQYEFSDLPVTAVQEEIFRYYGAPKVVNVNYQQQSIQVERDGIDCYDHHILYHKDGFQIFQRQKKLLILAPHLFLDRGVIRELSTFKEIKLTEKFDSIFASYYRGINHF